MTAIDIIQDLRRRGVELQAAGDRLRFRPAGAIPPDLLERLREHKAEIIAALETTTVRARVRGADEVVPTANPEECWHCHGLRICRCALCGQRSEGMVWKEAQCLACLGSGYLTWPEKVQ